MATAQQVGAGGKFLGNVWLPSFASSEIHSNDLLVTAGNLRPGFLQVQFTGDVNVGPDGRYGNLTLGLDQVRFADSSSAPSLLATCQFNFLGCGSVSQYFANYGMIPVLLGTAFEARVDSLVYILADINTGSSSGTIAANYQYQFFEADGITPVAVAYAPEPSSALLLVSGGILSMALWWRRRARQLR